MTSKQRDELQKISAASIMYPVGYGLQNLQCNMSLQEIKDIVDTIIAEPPRNCDVFSKTEVLEVLETVHFPKMTR